MVKIVDDFAGAIYNLFKFIIKSLCYLLAGMIIVGIPMYLIILVFGMFQ